MFLFSAVHFVPTEFTVKVMAEDDSLLSTTTTTHLSMKMWNADIKQNTPPARVST